MQGPARLMRRLVAANVPGLVGFRAPLAAWPGGTPTYWSIGPWLGTRYGQKLSATRGRARRLSDIRIRVGGDQGRSDLDFCVQTLPGRKRSSRGKVSLARKGGSRTARKG